MKQFIFTDQKNHIYFLRKNKKREKSMVTYKNKKQFELRIYNQNWVDMPYERTFGCVYK